jgi:riboflavin synthase
MFTGVIEAVGTVAEVVAAQSGFRLRIATPLSRELAPGASIAVNGVCLTIVSADANGFATDVSPETAKVTGLGRLAPGSVVNLERALRADTRIDGHFVLGHVDGTGTIETLRPDGESYWLGVRFPTSLSPYLVRKGSVAVDGISLTVAALGEHQFDVQIIPFTWDHTNLRAAREGDTVNLECDILGKYVVRVAELSGLASRLSLLGPD